MKNKHQYIENAINWAKEHLGSPNYVTFCLAFVEDAYEKSNSVEIFGGASAKESADEYNARQNTGEPELGSFVFYDCMGEISGFTQNWGHVGLCIEPGLVIHAWDVVRIDNYRDVEKLTPAPGWTKPEYIGWSPFERIFQGYVNKS